MTKGYTTKTDVENYLLITIDSSFDNQIDNWIESMERYIDKITGRNFIADDTESVRVYDGDNTNSLLIEDCVEITKLNIDGGSDLELGNDKDYVLYPLNKLPITRVKLTGGVFPRYPYQSISVEAKWGYSVEVPADIRQVATVLVAGIINYSLQAEGEVKSMNIGAYSVTYKDEKQWQDFERVSEILNYYKKYTF